MAEVAPFKAIVYNTRTVLDMADVVTPPYDVISPGEQDAFHTRHPKNIVRLILGKPESSDSETENPHTRAACFFDEWKNDGTLVTDPAPAFYLTTHEFHHAGSRVSRLGVLARVRLEPFDKGIVRPHEKTFSKVKSERLSLFKRCHANFSPIFTLFPDEGGKIFSMLSGLAAKNAPDLDFTESVGHRHRMWRITDPAGQAAFSGALSKSEVFIADGHHRYETALNYLAWREEKEGPLPPDHPARFVLMYLCSMDDPGLVILPAHRMLTRLSPEALARLDSEVPRYFSIETFPLSGDGRPRALAALSATPPETTGILLLIAGAPFAQLLTLKPGVMDSLFSDVLAPSLRRLDVSVLTHLLFQEILGLTPADMDDADLLRYTINADTLASEVISGRMAAGFVINPSRICEVRDVARDGLVMPRKSTYFYPKVVTGLVMNSLL